MTKPIVLCLGNILFAQGIFQHLESIAECVTLPEDTTREKFFALLDDPTSKFPKVSIITRKTGSIKQTGRFDKELAEKLPNIVVAIYHNGAVYSQIDVRYFNDKHIQVSNTPHIVSNATADNHVFLLLGALRNFSYGLRNLLEGK